MVLLLPVSLLCLWSKEEFGPFGVPRQYRLADHGIFLVELLLVHLLPLSSSSSAAPLSLLQQEDVSQTLYYFALVFSAVATLRRENTVAEAMRRAILPFSIYHSLPALMAWVLVMAYHLRIGFGHFPAPDWTKEQKQQLSLLFLCIGTRGDVQPFVHLAREMQRRGHRVAICALEPYRNLVEQNEGIAFYSAGEEDLEEAEFWRKCTHVSQVMDIPNFEAHFSSVGHALHRAAVAAEPHVMVCTSTAQSMALTIADALAERPLVMCAKFAPDNPTRALPAPGYGGRSLALVPNLLTWYHHWLLIGLAANRIGMGSAEDAFRKELGLAKLTAGKRLGEMAHCPTLLVFSPLIIPRGEDWPASLLVTGWWHNSNPMPAPLRREEKTLCITFGSMTRTAEAIGLLSILLETCLRAGWKIVLVGGANTTITDERVLAVHEADYNALFPRMQCVIHHGGAGTTSSCIATNTPSIILPILLWTDQPLWAERVAAQRLGVRIDQTLAFCDSNPQAIREEGARISASLLKALDQVLASAGVWPELQEMSQRLAQERGCERAARAIEYCLCAHREV